MTLGLLPNFVNTAALRYFYEVARYGSLRLASEKIHIAASAISRQIQLLEQEVGVPLFSRGRKGLRLTAAGEALLFRVKKAMDELSTARTEIEGLGDTHTGTVRIGLNETIARDFFASFLKKFSDRNPHVKFEVTIANSDELEAALLRGDIDIAMGYAVQAREHIQFVVSFDLNTCISVNRRHPLAKRRSVRVADLVDEKFIMPSADSILRKVFNEIFSKTSMRPVSTLTTGSFEFMASMVAQGFGIGCQVRVAVGPDPQRPEIVYVPIRDPEVRSAVLACCIATDAEPSPAVLVCLQELRTALEAWRKRGRSR